MAVKGFPKGERGVTGRGPGRWCGGRTRALVTHSGDRRPARGRAPRSLLQIHGGQPAGAQCDNYACAACRSLSPVSQRAAS
ncbi:hypothetical protein I79_007513 [Cricetulus griseus]|uniref:Uncharacterized protein n=1 Tax=Cricetulus griseus TaxID=10029 RepID=G3HAQ5_CRIGR|nr:hypothetical protein I79_007513 [Cricetulus griseus]